MSYNGYLIKLSSNDFDFNKYIVAESYKVAKKVLDLDSYRDANGVLHRNVLGHTSYTVEFDIKPLTNTRLEPLMSAIRGSFASKHERKLTISFYLPETNSYETAEVYMPDIEFPIVRIENDEIHYSKITLKFIGY